MPKDGGFLTPKAIANRIKAKGLQKLRFYCQMCQKQCRDANGFNAHATSQKHLRQMALFRDNQDAYLDDFSRQFESGMMEIIQRRARSKPMNANHLYHEYIADKAHVHMNATIWETLTDFVMYLGREGKCEVEETERGWVVTYVDHAPETLRALEARAKRERSELSAEERRERELARLAKSARAELGDGALLSTATNLERDDPQAKVVIGGLGGGVGSSSRLAVGSGKARPPPAAVSAAFNVDAEETLVEPGPSGEAGKVRAAAGGRLGPQSSMRAVMNSEEARKAAREAPSTWPKHWLLPRLIVKVLNKRLADGKYHNQKGTIESVAAPLTARVRMHATGDLLQLDQLDLQTVIPSQGGPLVILKGAHRGARAQLVAIDVNKYCVSVKLDDGAHAGRVVDNLAYEDVCKLDSHSW